MDRFGETTEYLRDAGVALLLDVGPRAFTQEALAERGYVAVGTVYQRWSGKAEALADLAEFRLLPALSSFRGTLDDLFDSNDGRRLLRLTSDVLLAGRDHSDVRTHVEPILERLHRIVGRDDPTTAWWMSALAVGWGMLLAGRDDLPSIAPSVSRIVEQRPRSEFASTVTQHVDTDLGDLLPPSPPTIRTDDKGAHVKASARGLLATPIRTGLSARDVSQESGISTGSIYRRFPSLSELLRALLVDEVQSNRYAWSAEMVSALTSDNPIEAASDVIGDAITKVLDDHETQNVILELTVAARSEETLRTQLLGQIDAAVRSRRALFDRLQLAGLVAPDADTDQLSWIFQAPPIGARLLGSLDRRPSDAEIRTGIVRVIRTFLSS